MNIGRVVGGAVLLASYLDGFAMDSALTEQMTPPCVAVWGIVAAGGQQLPREVQNEMSHQGMQR